MTTATINAAALSDTTQRRQLRRAVIASAIGTTIEWYDFFLYSIVTGLVFAKLYFPQSDPLAGTLQAYAVFFVGFLSRPIGAAIFGHYGDRIGRKSALIATLLLTGLATFAVGGVVRCCYPWSGRRQTLIVVSPPPVLSLAPRLVSPWQTSRYWSLARS